ncbi:MAG: DUF6913 domain-containing protein [Flavobacteriaceae bacterium]
MFLKGFKRKSAQKYLMQQLQEKRVVDQSKIRTVGVLVDATVFESFPFLNELAEVFGVQNRAIELLYYHPDKKVAETFSEPIFTDTNLVFKGQLNNSMATDFINKDFDVLLSFYNEDKLLLNLAAVRSKANYKIGFSGVNDDINDLCVVTELSDIKTFTFELKKYLSILNKI